jgi:hypothetical protein
LKTGKIKTCFFNSFALKPTSLSCHISRSVSLNSDARKLRSGESNSFKSGEIKTSVPQLKCRETSAFDLCCSPAASSTTLCHRAGQSLVFIPVDESLPFVEKNSSKSFQQMRTLTFKDFRASADDHRASKEQTWPWDGI